MKFHLHLISDSTGETVTNIARACLAQLRNAEAIEHSWWLIRTENQVNKVIEGIVKFPGIALCTFVNNDIQALLGESCQILGIPCIQVLDPVMEALAIFTGDKVQALPGQQHTMSTEYFRRIEAIHFTLTHDDGMVISDLDDADIIIIGASRTSKTPTSMYLAYRGLKVANVPFITGLRLPEILFKVINPTIIGLTRDPRYLVDIRRNRIQNDKGGNYTEYEAVKHEIQEAQHIFIRNSWPIVNMTTRSIEEAAAAILHYHARHKERL